MSELVMLKNRSLSYLIILTALLGSAFTAKAQDPVFAGVRKKFEDYNKAFVQEKIFVHTDKEFYLAGEIVWFKIYCLNAGTNKPMNASKVAYAEILDVQGKSVLQAKISLSKDGGSGSFYIPLSVNSGNFVFRSYTTWMRNFGEEMFFEKKITIVNTLKNAPAPGKEGESAATVAFFPEGGYLVNGINSKTGFTITDRNGNAVNARGFLIRNNADTVLSFSPSATGSGTFIFTPTTKANYTAKVILANGQVISQSLPEVKEHGYVMSVTDNNDGRYKVKVEAKIPDSYRGTPNLFLMAHSRNQVKVAQQGYLGTNNEFAWFINKGDLGNGVSHLTIFNDSGLPVSERLVFGQATWAGSATLATDRSKYGSRNEVKLSIQTNAGSNQNFNGSLSVYQVDSAFMPTSGIYNYLMFESELEAALTDSELMAGDFDKASNVENILLTHGWRRFKWDNIFSGSRQLKYLPEVDGHIVTGKVVNVSTGRPAVGVECYLSVPSYPFGFYLAKSDADGIVKFSVRNYFGSGEVIAQVSEKEREKYRIDLLSPYADLPPMMKVDNRLPVLNEEKLLDRSIAMQAQNIYKADSIKRYLLPTIGDTLPFYGKAEYSYKLDEFKRFTTMEEVFREYVMQINVRVQNSKLEMVIFDDITRQFYNENILVLLDGIPIYDYNKIFSYDPLKITRLEIVPRRYLYGSRVFSGIASFQSSNEKFDGFTLDPSLLAVDYEGLQLQREFYSPRHNNPTANSKRIPDLRTTLFWEPFVKTDANGKVDFTIFSSDMKGRYVAVLQGVNDEGVVVSGKTEFVVE